jgi:hypothetical protein
MISSNESQKIGRKHRYRILVSVNGCPNGMLFGDLSSGQEPARLQTG